MILHSLLAGLWVAERTTARTAIRSITSRTSLDQKVAVEATEALCQGDCLSLTGSLRDV